MTDWASCQDATGARVPAPYAAAARRVQDARADIAEAWERFAASAR